MARGEFSHILRINGSRLPVKVDSGCVCVCEYLHVYVYLCVCVYMFVYVYMCVCAHKSFDWFTNFMIFVNQSHWGE